MKLNFDTDSKEYKLLQLISTAIKGTIFENNCYLVGGSVRDLYMKSNKIKDIDIVVELENGGIAFANFITSTFNCSSESNPIIYERFGTAKFNLRNTDLSEIDIECVLTRVEDYSNNSRKPDVMYGSLLDDAKRRDLTINALYINLSSFELVQPLSNSISDIDGKIIRTPLNPKQTFKDDPLRMLRCIRFAFKYDFIIEDEVLENLFYCSGYLKNISKERIRDEFMKILSIQNPNNVVAAIRLLSDTNMMEYIIPELKHSINCEQEPTHHDKDVYNHTLEVVRNSIQNPMQRLTALLHDIGKPFSYQIEDGRKKFKGHDKVGSDMCKNILSGLKFSNTEIDLICKAVFNHMRCKFFGDDLKDARDKSIRKLVNDLGTDLEFCLDLMDADNKSHKKESCMNMQITNLKNKIIELKIKDNVIEYKLPIDGFDVMNLLQIRGGKLVGEVLEFCKDLYLEDVSLDKTDLLKIVENKFGKNLTL